MNRRMTPAMLSVLPTVVFIRWRDYAKAVFSGKPTFGGPAHQFRDELTTHAAELRTQADALDRWAARADRATTEVSND